MSSIVHSVSLIEFCKKAKTIVTGKSMLPALDNVLIQDGFLEVSDLSVTLRKKVDGIENDLDGCMVDFKILTNIVDKVTKQPLTLRFNRDELNIEIITDSGKFTLPCLLNEGDGKTFPLCPDKKSDVVINDIGTIGSKCVDLITRVVPFCDKDQLRPAMTTVELKDGFVNATDRHCLIHEACDDLSVAEPIMVVVEIVKLLDAKSDYRVQAVGTLNEKQEFTHKNLKLTSEDGYEIIYREMDDKYPNVTAVIPQTFNTTVTLDKKDFLKKINEAKICESQSSGTQIFNFDAVKKTLTVSSQDIDFNTSYYSSMPVVSIEGESIEIGFKSNFLLKLLKHDPKKDEVTLQLVDPERACIVDGKMLVMPSYIRR